MGNTTYLVKTYSFTLCRGQKCVVTLRGTFFGVLSQWEYTFCFMGEYMKRLSCLLLIFILLFCSCSKKIDPLQEHINLVKSGLEENSYNYVDVFIESAEYSSEDLYVNGELIHADRDLIIEVNFQNDVSENYAQMCNILKCVEDIYVQGTPKNPNPYDIKERVRCNGVTYKLTGYDLIETSDLFTSVYNILAQKNGKNWTKGEKEYVCESIEEMFKSGSYNAVLYGDYNFESRTFQTYADKYNIPVSDLRKLYDEYKYNKYH